MSEQTPPLPIPDFVDVDADAVAAAEASAKQGPTGWTIPKDTKIGDPTGAKKQRHARWSESVTIKQAYRTVTKTNLLDVVIVAQSRTGMPNENLTNFFHFYLNMACFNGKADEETQKKHGRMTEQSLGSITTLLKATGLMPKTGALKASLLNMLFPSKGQPGAKSPLDGKSVVVNAHGTVEIKKVKGTNPETGEEMMVDEEDVRVQCDTFNPEG